MKKPNPRKFSVVQKVRVSTLASVLLSIIPVLILRINVIENTKINENYRFSDKLSVIDRAYVRLI